MRLPVIQINDTYVNFNNVINWFWETEKTLSLKYVTGHSERFYFYSITAAKEFTQSVRKLTKNRNII